MKANIIIMGQSGNGKSTIVNSIMGKYVARTGKGAAVTTENQAFSTSYKIGGKKYDLTLYDTVGLELSDRVTRTTLNDIENYLRTSQNSTSSYDINIVWFCINYRSSRFQDFEIDLIRKLSYDYEIPFVIVMTQCIDERIGELESEIHSELPEVTTVRILAEDYPVRNGKVIPAYGLDDLLKRSVLDYENLKVRILETKLNDLRQKIAISEWYIRGCEYNAATCIENHSESAEKIGWLPVACIPFVHAICIKMVAELHQIYGMPSSESFAESIFTHVILGVLTTPLMMVPILSAGAAVSYVSTIGEEYADTLSSVMSSSEYGELNNQKLMTERIQQQLNQKKEGKAL